jgi:hypothetical protein
VETSGETTEKDFRFDLLCADDIFVVNAGDGRPGLWKPRKRKRAMNTEKKLEWEVVRGFGDIVDSPKDCIDVQVLKRRFASQADAESFAETHYDGRIEKLMRRMPDWWKSFFVTVRKATN